MRDGGGLFLTVRPSGSKYWQFRYRFLEREKTLSFGKYPGTSLRDAREERSNAEKLIKQGIDPSVSRKREKLLAIYRDRNSLECVAKEWHERNKGSWKKQTASNYWSRLSTHILPALGARPVSEILPLELLSVVQEIEKTGATDMSHRVLRLCGAVYNYAIITGRATHNITVGLSAALKPHKVSHHPTLRRSEIGELLLALDQLNTSRQNKLAFRLLLLTAVRTGEMRFSKWADVDIEAKEWRIPEGITKMGTAHLVPLSTQAITILEELRSETVGSEWLVPSQRGWVHEVMSENTINGMIKRMGYKGRIVGHGFRSLFSTALNEEGFNRDAIERQLAHMERNNVRAAYNRAEYLNERREMMQWWADFLDGKSRG